MQLDHIIASLADRADDLLSDVRNEKEARTTLAEVIAREFPKMPPADRTKVITELLAILDEEGFFEKGRSGDSWSEGGEEGDEE